MIGQHNIQSVIANQIKNNTFPRFSIIVGPRGSGKKLIADYIRKCLVQYYPQVVTLSYGVGVDEVRSAINNAYKVITPTCFTFFDADTMSSNARNALLKVTEEPPNNAYFIMTLEDENNTLATIRSRATIFHMDRYTPDEIYQYVKQYAAPTLHDAEWKIIRDLCETPGEVNIVCSQDKFVSDFYNYVQLVVDNIADVSDANAFKIGDKIALKDGAEGYDLTLFWKAFERVCMQRVVDRFDTEDISRYGKAVLATDSSLKDLRIRGVNKLMLFDLWILEIRDLWN